MLIKNKPNDQYVKEVTADGRFITTTEKKEAATFTDAAAADFVARNGDVNFEAVEK